MKACVKGTAPTLPSPIVLSKQASPLRPINQQDEEQSDDLPDIEREEEEGVEARAHPFDRHCGKESQSNFRPRRRRRGFVLIDL